MILWFVVGVFALMLLLPFLPGIMELLKKADADALFIAMDHKRNPRYFGKSFREILRRGMEGISDDEGYRDVRLSKNEQIEICQSSHVGANRTVSHILVVKEQLISGSHVQFQKELFVAKSVLIGPHNELRALAADGPVKISNGAVVHRWIDAEGEIHVGDQCRLGISVSSPKRIVLSRGCVFRRLFAMPIATGKMQASVFTLEAVEEIPDGCSFVRKRETSIPPGSILRNHLVFLKGITVGAKSVIIGNIKSYGNLVLEDCVTVHGNVFADGDIFIGEDVRIRGHVFSQKAVTVSRGACISGPGKIKSLIGKRAVRLEKDVTIFGFVSTEGSGVVL